MQGNWDFQIDHIKILEQLGSKPLVDTFLAENEQGLRVLVKLSRKTLSESEISKFSWKSARHKAIQDEHLLPLLDAGITQNRAYLVMPYLEAPGTIEQLQTVDWEEIIQSMLPVMRAVIMLHKRNIHLFNLSPDSLWVDDGRIILADYGTFDLLNIQTGFSEYVFAPYAAPETLLNYPADHRADIYSLGMLLYKMLGGDMEKMSLPIESRDADRPQGALKLPADIPEKLQKFIFKAIEIRKDDRFRTMTEFKSYLEDLFIEEEEPVIESVPDFIEDIQLPDRKLNLDDFLDDPVKPETAPEGVEKPRKTRSRRTRRQKNIDQTLRKKKKQKFSLRTLLLLALVFSAAGFYAYLLISNYEFQPREKKTPTPTITATLKYNTLPPPSKTPTPWETMTFTPTTTKTRTPTITPTTTRTLTHTPLPVIGSTRTSKTDRMTMGFIPAGTFTRGTSQEEINLILDACGEDCSRTMFEDEMPQRAIYVDAFWMDQTEVTNAMYARFLSENNFEENIKVWIEISDPELRLIKVSRGWLPVSGYEDYPIVEVSWMGARAYCEWAGRRLPTEAEWEKAARGSDRIQDYPWGNDLDCLHANYGDCPGNLKEVGSLPDGASIYGVHDLAGNVWEWTADWYGPRYYLDSPDENPTGIEAGQYRVIRGGSWVDSNWFLRTTYRHGQKPDHTNGSTGFRCVMTEVTP